jgi:hypothetical protein
VPREFFLDDKLSLVGGKVAYIFLDANYTHKFLRKFYDTGRYVGERTLADYICEREEIEKDAATVLSYTCYPGLSEESSRKNEQQKRFLRHEINLKRQGVYVRKGYIQIAKNDGGNCFYEKGVDVLMATDAIKIGFALDPTAKYFIFFTFDCDFASVFDDLKRVDHTAVLYTGNSENPNSFHTLVEHASRHVHIRGEDFRDYLLSQKP